MTDNTYALITPARNEEAYIEKTIQSVISQTVLPTKWVIVSDGSTDKTDAIVHKYEKQYDFIQFIRTEGEKERNFKSKVSAFNVGYEQIKHEKFEFIGILDADNSFDAYYYQKILEKFNHDDRLGIAGGLGYENCRGKFQPVLCARNSVNGPFQLFRRQCYEDIGGFLPLERGGVDSVAEVMARRQGWRVESFPEFPVYHHRRMGTATTNVLVARFGEGYRMRAGGYHPVFHAARCLYLIQRKPYVVGSLLMFFGYYWAMVTRYKYQLPDGFVDYLRSEQMSRLQSMMFKRTKAVSDR